ncbi:MAG TPA: hypothetical protein VLA88_01700 [Candidatus Saccharimonadales bacterium]|nr:hypothetical protein [Candidatus Saccharimonadales bacterium]
MSPQQRTITTPLVVDGLSVRVAMFLNPYHEDVISSERLYGMIVEAAAEMASRIARRYHSGRYDKQSLASFIMDPTMPVGALPDTRYIMAAVLIGPAAEGLLQNAWGKIVKHMKTGQDCGVAVFVQPHRMGKGDFNWGMTAQLDGTLGGGSGLNQFQDKAEVVSLIADINEAVSTEVAQWERTHLQPVGKRPSWHTGNGTHGDKFKEILTLRPIMGEYVHAA